MKLSMILVVGLFVVPGALANGGQSEVEDAEACLRALASTIKSEEWPDNIDECRALVAADVCLSATAWARLDVNPGSYVQDVVRGRAFVVVRTLPEDGAVVAQTLQVTARGCETTWDSQRGQAYVQWSARQGFPVSALAAWAVDLP